MRIPTYQRQQGLNPSPLPQADPAALTQEYTAGRQLSDEAVRAAVEMETTRGIIAERAGRNDAISRANQADVEKEKIYQKHAANINVLDPEGGYAALSNDLLEVDKKHSDPQNQYLNYYYAPIAAEQNAGFLKRHSQAAAVALRNAELSTAENVVSNAVTHAAQTGNAPESFMMLERLSPLGLPNNEKLDILKKGQYAVADTMIKQWLETPGGIKRAQTELDNFRAQKESLFNMADPNKIDEYAKAIKQVDTAQVTTESLLKIKQSPDFRDENGEFDFTKAMRYVESPEFLKEVGDSRVVEATAISLARNQQLEDNIYRHESDALKGDLQVDILSGKIGKDNLPEDKRWLSLRAVDRGAVAGFADAKARSDRAEAAQARSLNLQALAMRKQDQREQAVAFEQETIGKIIEGKYADATQIMKDHSSDNPYIMANLPGAIALFNQINNAPELKAGLAQINKAASKGLFDSGNYQNNMVVAGELSTQLRMRYIKEPDFRGEKINAWLKERTGPAVKSGFGKMLDLLPGRSAEVSAEQRNLEYTAKKYGITVEQVKERMRKKNAR